VGYLTHYHNFPRRVLGAVIEKSLKSVVTIET
jgi:hypothetical protein